jgi:hypothetical protein
VLSQPPFELTQVKADAPARRDSFQSRWEEKMRLAALLWIMGGTVLAGLAVMVVLVIPSLQAEAMRLIPVAAVLGYIVGVPVAYLAAKAIAPTAS